VLLLVSTSDVLSLVTDVAATIDVQASYNDYNGTTVTPGRLNTAINTATTTTIVAAPGASVQRSVSGLRIRNTHATLSCRVTIRHTDGTTAVDVYSAWLPPGGVVQYTDRAGFLGEGARAVVSSVLLKNVHDDTAVLKLAWSLPMVPGTYVVDADILYETIENSGLGVRISLAHSGTVTTFVWEWAGVDNAATSTNAQLDQSRVSASLMCHFSSRAGSATSRGTTVTADEQGAPLYLRVQGLLVCTVAGDLQVWFGTEDNLYSVQLRHGSAMSLTRVA
jgi:hypothetical protein